ncbi:hypothetical protein LIER_35302 [Lithospermum erythrorhizon]|uniref:HAT C-terminal dimerisation domain-containing protein n=1 Tax=Lithospermum erythrorhizon TaxID=34254 RepID=A0AAV3NT73_LITER
MLEVDEVYEDVFHLMGRIDNSYKKYFSIVKDNSNYDNDDDRDLDLCEEEDKQKKLKSTSDRRIGPPTHDNCVHARSFVKFLKLFFEVTLAVSGSNYVTDNNLFLQVIGVHSAINSYVTQVHDLVLSSMALYEDSSGESMSQMVKDELYTLFHQYESCSVDYVIGTQVVGGSSKVVDNILGAFDFLKKCFAEHLEMVETKESNFELIRCIGYTVSTVASEAAFSTSGRIIDPYRSRLAPLTIEALICTQNWLRTKAIPVCLKAEVDESEENENKEDQDV